MRRSYLAVQRIDSQVALRHRRRQPKRFEGRSDQQISTE